MLRLGLQGREVGRLYNSFRRDAGEWIWGRIHIGDIELVHLYLVGDSCWGDGTRYSHNRASGGRILTIRNSFGVE